MEAVGFVPSEELQDEVAPEDEAPPEERAADEPATDESAAAGEATPPASFTFAARSERNDGGAAPTSASFLSTSSRRSTSTARTPAASYITMRLNARLRGNSVEPRPYWYPIAVVSPTTSDVCDDGMPSGHIHDITS